MDEKDTVMLNLRKRRNLGIALLVGGVVPMIALMIYIVVVGTPGMMVIVATVASWLVFFAGKTIMKTATLASAREERSRLSADPSPPASH
ncbi:MAG: hypothetical protein JJU11_03895 [Candidatus Sumerlaeia bacterium]|nr:hypothetical protein [Candidatus Sumerlaeia bacterium]